MFMVGMFPTIVSVSLTDSFAAQIDTIVHNIDLRALPANKECGVPPYTHILSFILHTAKPLPDALSPFMNSSRVSMHHGYCQTCETSRLPSVSAGPPIH